MLPHVVNVHAKAHAKCGNRLQHVATLAHLKHTMAKRRGFVCGPSAKTPLVPTPSGGRYNDDDDNNKKKNNNDNNNNNNNNNDNNNDNNGSNANTTTNNNNNNNNKACGAGLRDDLQDDQYQVVGVGRLRELLEQVLGDEIGVRVVRRDDLAGRPAVAVYRLRLLLSTASGRGQDKRGRRRSAASPDNQRPQENVTTCGRNMATCGKRWRMWQNVRT